MSRFEKFLDKLLKGGSDRNLNFDDVRWFLKRLGFVERIRGDHHIFSREDVHEIVNLQPRGNLAKPYQIKQIREMIVRHSLATAEADADEADVPDDETDDDSDAQV